jgi:hypothetical protein
MKVLWTIVVLLVLGGLIVLMQPHANERQGAIGDQAFVDAAEEAIARAPAAPEGPKPVVDPTPLPGPDSTAAASAPAKNERPVTPITGLDPDPAVPASPTEPELKQLTRKDEKLAPSAEPAKPDPATVAAGQRFEPDIPPVAYAEILPSTFVKLADGSISADDAWTIRGSGTAEEPYEVSWEFLASAQDTYSPRLSENKIPARIAFLSGKRVRISGYLAFPLVASTSGECLLMLNQWDGCCIGIPPTPYDAIEVKLATEIKGWKKHTFNFGAIEGTFTVEPYLVENWLVGLYMMKDATLNREL